MKNIMASIKAFCLVALCSVYNLAIAAENTSEEILSREDDLRNTLENSSSSMADATADVAQTGVDIMLIIWMVAVPVVLGFLLVSGILTAKKEGLKAAQNTFLALGLGVIAAGVIFTYFL